MKINPQFVRFAACAMALSQSATFAQDAASPPTNPAPETGASTSAQVVDATPPHGMNSANSVFVPGEATGARPFVTGPLSLQKAVEIALANSPILRGATADLDVAAARVKAAQAARKPSLSATTFLTTGSETGPIYNSPDGVTPQNLFAVPRGAFADQNLMLMLPLLNGGRLQALTRQAQAARAASGFDLQTARLDVALDTKTAYRQTLLALETQKVAAARQNATTEQLRNDRAAEKAGRVPQLFVLRDEAEDADAGQDVTNAARDVELALISLRALMGARTDSDFSLTDSLETLNEDDSASNLQTALANRPELQGARARLESTRQGENAVRGSSKFQAALTGMADLGGTRSGSSGGLSVGLVVGVPIFDGGMRRAGRDEARAQISRAQADVSRLEIQVEREVAGAQVSLDAARKNVATAQSALVAAQEGYRVALLRYQGGRATNAETLDALAALTRARTNRARALYNAQIASDQLGRAVGRG